MAIILNPVESGSNTEEELSALLLFKVIKGDVGAVVVIPLSVSKRNQAPPLYVVLLIKTNLAPLLNPQSIVCVAPVPL